MKSHNYMAAQSGGPTVAINASLAGVVHTVISNNPNSKVYGALNGILGILNDRMLDLSEKAANTPDFISLLKTTPAMYLGSCRFRLPDYTTDESPYVKIFESFEKYDIDAFFYIGGNDSMDTVLKLSEYASHINSKVRIVGIPKTIDNDLMITDHTPGFGSAAKYIASSILEIAHDTFIYAVKSVTIVEIMGRDAGWLTAASVLARNSYNTAPHLIYLPEAVFDKNQFLDDVQGLLTLHNNVIVAVSEGIRDINGNYISAGSCADSFGHSQLSGTGKALELLIKNTIDVKVRSVEVNVLQRCAAHLASLTDINESFELGSKAVDCANSGHTGEMVVIKRVSNTPYTVSYETAPIKEIANEAKSVPREWINDRGNDILPPLLDYLTPLIQGETDIKYENGLPHYLDVSHLIVY